MADLRLSEGFLFQLTGCQPRLYAYITALVHDPAAAQDVLQETNLVLCRKAAEADAKDDFVGWACKVAYFQVMAWRRDRGRDRHVFDEALVGQLAERAAGRSARFTERHLALRLCLAKLSEPQRELLNRRYEANEPVAAIGAALGRPASSIANTLHRIRKRLLDCVRRETVAEESA